MDGVKIEVTGNIARIVERPARITSGTVGLPVEFSFDSQWDGLSKTAVFCAGRVVKIAENLEAETIVPWEVLERPNVWLCIGVYGVNDDGTVAIPTIWANVCVICEGVNPDGDASTAPTLPVWQRLWNAVGNLLGLTTNAKGNLVEAINEVHNIALAGGIETDPTFTQKGKAADAMATGDEFWKVWDQMQTIAQAIESVDYPGCYYRMVNGMEEWLNPPMKEGVAYRTTERFDGRPVFTAVVNCGTTANGKTVSLADYSIATPLRLTGVMSSIGRTIPYGTQGNESDVHCYIGDNAIKFVCGETYSGKAALVQIWYTKRGVSA
jgi:hypothetical protein